MPPWRTSSEPLTVERTFAWAVGTAKRAPMRTASRRIRRWRLRAGEDTGNEGTRGRSRSSSAESIGALLTHVREEVAKRAVFALFARDQGVPDRQDRLVVVVDRFLPERRELIGVPVALEVLAGLPERGL